MYIYMQIQIHMYLCVLSNKRLPAWQLSVGVCVGQWNVLECLAPGGGHVVLLGPHTRPRPCRANGKSTRRRSTKSSQWRWMSPRGTSLKCRYQANHTPSQRDNKK